VSPAGYSGTPLPRKLGIRDGHTVLLSRAPDEIADTLGSLPPGVRLHRRAARGDYDVILLFARHRSSLEERLGGLAERLAWTGGLWICWPKRASGVATDLSDGVVRALGLGAGLEDHKVCAVDETWTGLRFV
jgi:hypothetical protein